MASPAASGSPAAGTGIDGARMVEAAEKAAEAAQAANAAVAATAASSSASPPAAKATERYKMLPNLQLFRHRAAKRSCQCFVSGFGSLSNIF